MGLEFEQDWFITLERDKEKIINEIASQLAKESPEMFNDSSFLSNDRKSIESLVRRAVITRSDLVHASGAEEIISAIMGQVTGYGVVQEFFVGPGSEEITEIFINPSKDGPRIFYGKHGRCWPAEKRYFKDNEEVLRYCQKICEDVGRPFTEDASIVDAWLADGSRIAVVGFKTSPLGVSATIRKSPTTRPPMPLERLVEFGMLPQFAADLLVDLLVHGHANIGVFGRTDSGKTTFLRALALFIDALERTFIAETSFEIYLPNLQNVVNLVEVIIGDKIIADMGLLVRTMNRSNPDRAILGEIRGKEIVAASRMASSTSGGFWTTGHAGNINTLRTTLKGMYREAHIELLRKDLDEEISSMFNFLIFLDKETLTKKAQRTLMEIVEVVPGAGYRTIIRFDAQEFGASRGKIRRWVYENPVSPERLSALAFRGANVKSGYEKITEKYIQ